MPARFPTVLAGLHIAARLRVPVTRLRLRLPAVVRFVTVSSLLRDYVYLRCPVCYRLRFGYWLRLPTVTHTFTQFCSRFPVCYLRLYGCYARGFTVYVCFWFVTILPVGYTFRLPFFLRTFPTAFCGCCCVCTVDPTRCLVCSRILRVDLHGWLFGLVIFTSVLYGYYGSGCCYCGCLFGLRYFVTVVTVLFTVATPYVWLLLQLILYLWTLVIWLVPFWVLRFPLHTFSYPFGLDVVWLLRFTAVYVAVAITVTFTLLPALRLFAHSRLPHTVDLRLVVVTLLLPGSHAFCWLLLLPVALVTVHATFGCPVTGWLVVTVTLHIYVCGCARGCYGYTFATAHVVPGCYARLYALHTVTVAAVEHLRYTRFTHAHVYAHGWFTVLPHLRFAIAHGYSHLWVIYRALRCVTRLQLFTHTPTRGWCGFTVTHAHVWFTPLGYAVIAVGYGCCYTVLHARLHWLVTRLSSRLPGCCPGSHVCTRYTHTRLRVWLRLHLVGLVTLPVVCHGWLRFTVTRAHTFTHCTARLHTFFTFCWVGLRCTLPFYVLHVGYIYVTTHGCTHTRPHTLQFTHVTVVTRFVVYVAVGCVCGWDYVNTHAVGLLPGLRTRFDLRCCVRLYVYTRLLHAVYAVARLRFTVTLSRLRLVTVAFAPHTHILHRLRTRLVAALPFTRTRLRFTALRLPTALVQFHATCVLPTLPRYVPVCTVTFGLVTLRYTLFQVAPRFILGLHWLLRGYSCHGSHFLPPHTHFFGL